MPCVSLAQATKSTWTNLSALQPGQKIQVVEMNSKKDSGIFSMVTKAAITLQRKSGEQTIQRQDVRIVRLMKNNHRLRHTLIGAGIGAGLGAGIGAASYHPCTPPPNSFVGCIFDLTRGQQAGVFGIIGFFSGMVTGALWPTHEIVYRVAEGRS
jgi:hypothetical protein